MRISDWSSDVCSSDLLAEKSSFMEVSYLLLNGELPTQDELDTFTHTITRHTMLHEQLATFYRGFRRDAHPMAIMCGVIGALSAFYHDRSEEHTSELQSLMRISYAVFCLKNKTPTTNQHPTPRPSHTSKQIHSYQQHNT